MTTRRLVMHLMSLQVKHMETLYVLLKRFESSTCLLFRRANSLIIKRCAPMHDQLDEASKHRPENKLKTFKSIKLSFASLWFLDLHSRSRKRHTLPSVEQHWLVGIWNIRMHDWTVSELLNSALKTL